MNPLPDWLATWWCGMDTGISSKTIAIALAENTVLLQTYNWLGTPSDPADVGRCVRLLDLAEANGARWRERLPEVVRVWPGWAKLVPRWPEIEAAYREQLIAEREMEANRWRRKDGGRRVNPLPRTYPPSRCYWLVQGLQGHDPYARDVPHPFGGAP